MARQDSAFAMSAMAANMIRLSRALFVAAGRHAMPIA